MPESDDQEIIIETIQAGNSLKVSAVEPVTGTEVCIVCPTTVSEEERVKLALQKLRYVLKKNQTTDKL